MSRLTIIPIILLASAQMSFAAGGGSGSTGSSTASSSSSAGGSSYSTSSNDNTPSENQFLKTNQFIEYGKFDEAHKALLSLPDIGNRAERYNLLGFTARKSGNLVIAGEYYEKALKINSKHVGALQYQGELFITLGEIEKAKQNLVRIEKICWLFSCSESTTLEKAIQKATNS